MMTILLEGQNLSVSTPHIVAGTKDYLSVEIVRGVDWKGLNLHIFFQLDNKTYELITDGDYIGPSAHINLSAGMWQVSATGYEYVDGQLVMKITTNKIGLSVAPAPPESGEDLPYIPPTSIEQIEAIAQSVRDDADAGLFKGDKGDPGDPGQPGTTDYEQLENKPTKVSEFENDSGYVVGVTDVAYEAMFGGEFTITTETDADHEHPWALIPASGTLDNNHYYRVTINGVQHVFAPQVVDWNYGSSNYLSVYVGDISLSGVSAEGLLNEQQSASFLVFEEPSNRTGLYTSEPGTYTVLIEKGTPDYEMIPKDLVYGRPSAPFTFTKKDSGFDVFSIGANRFPNIASNSHRCAFGHGNIVSGQGAVACATLGIASGDSSFVTNIGTKASGHRSFASGNNTVSSGNNAHSEGQRTIAGGAMSHAEGDGNRAYANTSHVEGAGNYVDESQIATHVGGVNNAVTTDTGKTVSITRYNEDGTVGSTSTKVLGKYAEVIGNGDSDQARSNARTLDWDGNEELAGGLTLGLGTADETHITAAQLKALLALL